MAKSFNENERMSSKEANYWKEYGTEDIAQERLRQQRKDPYRFHMLGEKGTIVRNPSRVRFNAPSDVPYDMGTTTTTTTSTHRPQYKSPWVRFKEDVIRLYNEPWVIKGWGSWSSVSF